MTRKNQKFVLDTKLFRQLEENIDKITEEEHLRLEKLEIAREEKLKKRRAASRTELQTYGILRDKDPKPTLLNEETKKKMGPILRKAYELRQEQEDEIKHCNSLILSAKCLAINYAQLAEKENRQKGEKEEARKYELLLDQERYAQIQKYNDARETEQKRKDLYVTEIKQQIKKNETDKKNLEIARIAEDAQIRMEGSQKAQNDELKHHKEKLEKKEQIRKTLLLFKSMLNDKKLSEIEIENNENLERLEYNRKKQEQEEEYKKELMKKKNLREREINKVQANQKASQDTQALKDELMAIRIQDKVEREFRRKELEDEMKKIQINNDLKEARRQQIESNRESAIMEEKIDQEQLDKILRFNIEDKKKNEEIIKQNNIKIKTHLKSLKQQMVEKEFEKIKERRMFFREGVTYQENKNAREKALRMTVEEKIAELKRHNVPIKYVQDIERKIKHKKW